MMLRVLLVFLLATSVAGAQLFERVRTEDCGVDFSNTIIESDSFNVLTDFYAYNGGGVGVGDVNDDGLLDLFFTATQGPDKLFVNDGGLKFHEVSFPSDRPTGVISNGVVMTDIDGDGWTDILIARRYAPSQIWINDGGLRFTEKSEQLGIRTTGHTTQFAVLDYDGDGDLDVFAVNNGEPRRQGYLNKGFNDQLFQQQADGRFVEVTKDAGIVDVGYGLSAGVGDVNNDGWQDVFVANDFEEPDNLWINQGDGTFLDQARQSFQSMSWASMGSEIADLNNDGRLDIISLDMLPREHQRRMTQLGNMSIYGPFFDSAQRVQNAVHINMGNARFANACYMSNMAATDWSWSVLAADFDNDGHRDVFITNGVKRDVGDQDYAYNLYATPNRLDTGAYRMMPRSWLPNFYFRGSSSVMFQNWTTSAGLSDSLISNGAAYADLDNDGDLDLVLNNTDTTAVIYRNTVNDKNSNDANWIQLTLVGRGKNPLAIGARVIVHAGENIYTAEQQASRGYLSSVDPQLHIGLGKNESVDSLIVIWPDRQVTKVNSLEANRHHSIAHDGGPLAQFGSEQAPLLTELDAKKVLNVLKRENRYDDFKRERLLPYRYSRQGPAIASGDVNGDRLEDVIITGPKFAYTTLHLQQADGTFTESTNSGLGDTDESEDVDVVLFDIDSDQDLDVLVISGGNEFSAGDFELANRLYLNDGSGTFTRADEMLPEPYTSSTCAVTADIDNDGDLDVFIGGGAVPAEFPRAEPSRILVNESGRFIDATDSLAADFAEHLGIVTDATWYDRDNDGDQDIVVVGHWSAPAVFDNRNGKLHYLSLPPSGQSGIYESVNTADLDLDGLVDVIFGNVGWNCRYVGTADNPLNIWYGDFDQNGSIDPIQTFYDTDGSERPTRSRMVLTGHMPALTRNFNTYGQYASATIADIIDDPLETGASRLVTNAFHSYIAYNGANSLQVMDPMAQLAPIHVSVVEDLNADGHPDLILLGNSSTADRDVVALDGGLGLVMLGDGEGGFRPLTSDVSGLDVGGDARDAVVLDRADGSRLLIVTVNSEYPKLYVLPTN